MLTMDGDDLRGQWDRAMGDMEAVLSDLGRSTGQLWDPESLAVFLDVPSLAAAGLIRKVRAAGLAAEVDFLTWIRKRISAAMAKLRRAGVEGAGRPLPIEFGLTEAILLWDWTEMEAADEDACYFFERLRELRLSLPEVSLCERTVHRFLERVPPMGIRP